MNALLTTDTLAVLGDERGALRGLWADVTQEQGTRLDVQAIAHYLKPEAFAPVIRQRVLLMRTFNQPWPDGRVVKYWRVMSRWHPNYGSDLSVEGLRQWGVI